jgi:hypothetical protein
MPPLLFSYGIRVHRDVEDVPAPRALTPQPPLPQTAWARGSSVGPLRRRLSLDLNNL